ncbi:deoxyribonuclease IV [Thermasporomyces composti]|jgi:deoxyribonuclease-4|uniref:Deoxyribonuclease-4 n=1 Tax=Thermasporomyces composti TaxID=696763 RepID=A0A3D9V401_THECX|nr:deoxyribonuclease IV [Thermasporomyces composti]REF36458.1 deoxyribonuclease-4 [Thermasporomyces composti]
MTSVPLGAHVDQEDPIEEARRRSADVAQFFLGDPQGWKGPVIAYPGGADALAAAAAQAGVGLYVHAPYVINVATTNNRIRIPSRKLLQQTLDAAAAINARGVVVHGGHVLKNDDPQAGFDNWRKCVERLEIRCPLLIENTAGGDNAMARRLERIARLWEAVSAADTDGMVGFCLDTCHFHAGGEELATVVDRVKSITGRIDLVHANDSQDAAGSGRDRHANLGSGQIAPEDLVAVVRAAGAPAIVETPGGAEGQAADIAWLRERLDAA